MSHFLTLSYSLALSLSLSHSLTLFHYHSHTLSLTRTSFALQDGRFKLFPNGTLRINNVEVYDGHVYGCETKTDAGRLFGQARVWVLGETTETAPHLSSSDPTSPSRISLSLSLPLGFLSLSLSSHEPKAEMLHTNTSIKLTTTIRFTF